MQICGKLKIFIFCQAASDQFVLLEGEKKSSVDRVRSNVQSLIGDLVIENLDPFWYACLPLFALRQVNEYGYGLCSLLLAYERYVSVCKAAEQLTLLRSERRKRDVLDPPPPISEKKCIYSVSPQYFYIP